MSKEITFEELPEDYKFVYKIQGCDHKVDFDTNTIVDKILSTRAKTVDEEVIKQLRNIGEAKGINELIVIDESKVLKIIKSLKDYEKIKKDYGVDFIKQLSQEPDDLKYKKLKALEIIKEKNVDVGGLKYAIQAAISCNATIINTKTKEFIKPYIYYNIPRPKNQWLTKEEFELLKEVLL